MSDSIFRKDRTAQGVARQRLIETLAKPDKRITYDPQNLNTLEIIAELDDMESMLLDVEVVLDGKMSTLTNKQLAGEFRALKEQINRLKKKLNLDRGCTKRNDEHQIKEIKRRIDNVEGYLFEVVLNKFELECGV